MSIITPYHNAAGDNSLVAESQHLLTDVFVGSDSLVCFGIFVLVGITDDNSLVHN